MPNRHDRRRHASATRRGLADPPDHVRDVANAISRKFLDDGNLIAAGFAVYRDQVIAADAPPVQVDECRLAFFAGAQHLFGTIANVLDPGDEPTEADLHRMDLIDAELRRFIAEYEMRTVRTEGSA